MAPAAFLTAILIFIGAASAKLPEPPLHDPISAVQGLITRLIPAYIDAFELTTLAPVPVNGTNYEVFEIKPGSAAGKVALAGSTGVALASALNYYLKYTCNASVTWGDNGTGLQLDLPKQLPTPTAMRMVRPVKYSYYFNVCTFGYSTAFWDWSRWQFEIDWMALNGINMPLSFVGQEYVWAQVFTELGLTEADLQQWFSGPAFLPWQRMGNIRMWANPLDPAWRLSQMQLNVQIVNRQREFGMISVLPGFAGHVPLAISRLTPNVTYSAEWAGFTAPYCCAPLLEASDPLFVKIGASFVRYATAAFGTDHVYQGDTFNEMEPSSNNASYVQSWSQAVYAGIQAADPQGVWLMQGWLFLEDFWTPALIEAYLDGVPNDGMIVLDLFSENSPIWSRTDSYYGKPFIWCALHTFGGVRDLHGDLEVATTGPVAALATPGSTMVGTGLTMEAIETNPVYYELVNEMGWRSAAVDVPSWVQQYARRRYGSAVEGPAGPFVETAWSVLQSYVYDDHDYLHSPMELSPSLGASYHHNATAVTVAWRNLQAALDADNSLGSVGPFIYDYVDVARQQLVNGFTELRALLVPLVGLCFPAADSFTAYPNTDSNGPGISRVCNDPPTPTCGLPPSTCDPAQLQQQCLNTPGCVDVNSNGWMHGATQKYPCVNTTLYIRDTLPPNSNCLKFVEAIGAAMQKLISDLDTLMYSEPNFLVGRWIERARNLGATPAEKALLEFNARNQLTLWGPTGQINDYASKPWAGLLGDYYLGRWTIFLNELSAAIEHAEPLNQTQFQADLLVFEQQWNNDTKTYPSDAVGDAAAIGTRLFPQYGGPADFSKQFSVMQNTDTATPSSLYTSNNRDLSQIAWLCSLDISCLGFSSLGLLKTDVSKTVASSGVDLYIKL